MTIRSLDYMGHTFGVWHRDQSWFWSVLSSRGAIVGVASSEAEAIREACSSLDEISSRSDRAAVRALNAARLINWEDSLNRLQRYLAQQRAASA